jgi:hypothetical protein
MRNSLNEQVYQNMNLRETDDLLEIWQKNDRVKWSEAAFEVIKEILQERRTEIPAQDMPIFEYSDEELEKETYDFSEEELAIIDDKNPPEFYNPFEVLKISKWIEKAALASIAITIVGGLTAIPETRSIVMSYLYGNPSLGFLATLITLAIFVVATLLQIAVLYFPLRALAYILKVLMQMEFNSRPKQS